MANSFFQFKQFTVHQSNNMMKVCTDSCLFGAWVAYELQKRDFKNVLDIGTGTGLLSLMIAQKSKANITAIEVNPHAFEQARKNIENSVFREAISLNLMDVQDFENETFDFIVCNPPFYANDLKSGNRAVNLARHDEGLTFEKLLLTIGRLLNADGEFAVLIPAARNAEFQELAAKKNFFPYQELLLKQTEAHGPFRALLWFGKQTAHSVVKKEMVIRLQNGQYSDGLKSLLQDYYLSC